MPRPSGPILSRRALLAGGLAVGATGVLAACGSSGTSGAGSSDTGSDSGSGGAALATAQLAAFFPQAGGVFPAGSPQRLAFGLGDDSGALLDTGPSSLTFTVHQAGSTAAIGTPITAARHVKGLQRAYYPVIVDLPQAGSYQVSTTIGGRSIDAAFTIDDPAAVAIPQAGAAMPKVETPTTADAHGVDPICTASPQCPLHEVSLAAALQQGKPTALLISTPAFCQVGICGPVLDVLLSQRAAFGDRVQLIHAEVYQSGAAASKDPSTAPLAPAVQAFNLPFEPTIILAKADGTISERLDYIFDEGELQAALGRLVA